MLYDKNTLFFNLWKKNEWTKKVTEVQYIFELMLDLDSLSFTYFIKPLHFE